MQLLFCCSKDALGPELDDKNRIRKPAPRGFQTRAERCGGKGSRWTWYSVAAQHALARAQRAPRFDGSETLKFTMCEMLFRAGEQQLLFFWTVFINEQMLIFIVSPPSKNTYNAASCCSPAWNSIKAIVNCMAFVLTY